MVDTLLFIAAVLAPAIASALPPAARAGQAAGVCDSGGGSANVERAGVLYNNAVRASAPREKISLLEDSLRLGASFEAAYLLGRTLMDSQHEYRAARSCFTLALAKASTDAARARAAAQIAETYGALSCGSEQVNWLKKALAYQRYPNVEAALKEAVARKGGPDRTMSASEIRESLSQCDPTDKATRAFVVASVDLRINFAYDRADLTEQGREQARELGKALSSAELAGKAVTLVGHTDARGDAEYNKTLSRRRAEAVKAFLIREFRIPETLLTAEGHGKSELLLTGTSEEDHATNRRVELIVR